MQWCQKSNRKPKHMIQRQKRIQHFTRAQKYIQTFQTFRTRNQIFMCQRHNFWCSRRTRCERQCRNIRIFDFIWFQRFICFCIWGLDIDKFEIFCFVKERLFRNNKFTIGQTRHIIIFNRCQICIQQQNTRTQIPNCEQTEHKFRQIMRQQPHRITGFYTRLGQCGCTRTHIFW